MGSTDANESSDVFMLTTVDNPFSPFTQFREWLAYDTKLGYNSSALLDRVAITSDELSLPDQSLAIQSAIDEIVQENVNGMFRKVKRSDFKDVNPESED